MYGSSGGRAAAISDLALRNAEKGKLIVRVEDTARRPSAAHPLDMVVLATGLEGG